MILLLEKNNNQNNGTNAKSIKFSQHLFCSPSEFCSVEVHSSAKNQIVGDLKLVLHDLISTFVSERIFFMNQKFGSYEHSLIQSNL